MDYCPVPAFQCISPLPIHQLPILYLLRNHLPAVWPPTPPPPQLPPPTWCNVIITVIRRQCQLNIQQSSQLCISIFQFPWKFHFFFSSPTTHNSTLDGQEPPEEEAVGEAEEKGATPRDPAREEIGIRGSYRKVAINFVSWWSPHTAPPHPPPLPVLCVECGNGKNPPNHHPFMPPTVTWCNILVFPLRVDFSPPPSFGAKVQSRESEEQEGLGINSWSRSREFRVNNWRIYKNKSSLNQRL